MTEATACSEPSAADTDGNGGASEDMITAVEAQIAEALRHESSVDDSAFAYALQMREALM